jgi:glycogen(starch) synthase
MKIVFFADDFPPQSFGGAGISTCDLALGIREAGHEIVVITTCRQASDAGQTEYEGIPVFRIATNYSSRWRAYLSLYNPVAVREVKKLLVLLKPDVVHIHNVHQYLSYHCFKLAKQYAHVVVFTARDVMVFNYGKLVTKKYLEHFNARTTWWDHLKQAGKRYNPFRNLLIKKYLKYADKLLAVSEALKVVLEQNNIKNVVVMHTGINTKTWGISPDQVEQYREKFNLSGKKVILFGGRLSPTKGSVQTLEMLSKLHQVDNAVLLVVGQEDKLAAAIRREANKLGIGDRIVFTGWLSRDEIKSAYAVADVVLVPSICFDALPRIVLEAMAAARPVIATHYGGASEAIVDGETGYVINPFTVEVMAQKVATLLLDESKAKQFGEKARARVQAIFNLDDRVAEHIELYQRASKM